MTIQDEINGYIRLHRGITYSKIIVHFISERGFKKDTIKGCIKRFKKRFPLEYHPGISGKDFDNALKAIRRARAAEDDNISVSTERLPAHIIKALGLLSVSTHKDTVSTHNNNVSTLPNEDKTPNEGCVEGSSSKGVGDLKEKKKGSHICRTPKVVTINRPPIGIGFPAFVRDFGYPKFGGLFEFQKEIHDLCWDKKWSMINLPRDHGKSIYLAFLCQWAMDVHNWDVLYLGWTDRRKEISEFVYSYCNLMNIVESGKVKASSAYHFQLVNGAKFDTYLITAKEVLGMHALGVTQDQAERRLLIIIDDPIDETFREERHKEVKLETKWRSTISNINPDKIIFTGTKKFKEDFFYFIKKTYKKKLTHYYRRTHLCTPNIEDLDIFWGDLNHKACFLSYSEEAQNIMLEKALQHACYNPQIDQNDLRYKRGEEPSNNLLCPERWTEAELKEKREEVGEYWWHSEYEQNPHPITGEVWEDVKYIKMREHWKEYDMGMITVDSATATMATKAGTPAEKKLRATSFTGIIVMLRHAPTQEIHVLYDLTDYYEFEEKLKVIETFFQLLRQNYSGIKIKVVIEKQGGGDDIISSASARKEFRFSGHIVDVHQKRDKVMRIDDYLRVPIKKGKIKFLFNLRNSELIQEIMNFPYCDKFDAVDALATGIKEFENHILGMSPEEIKLLVDRIRQRRVATYEKNWTAKNQQPWVRQPKPRSRLRR